MKRTAVFISLAAVLFVLTMSGCAHKTGPTSTSPSLFFSTATSPPGQNPIDVLSVIGPIPPYNPGGPVVQITVKNVITEPVISLQATLTLSRTFNFTFDITSSKPLKPGKSISMKQTLIGASFSDNIIYPLLINGTLQSGATFSYIVEGRIAPPK
jgi:hypothetical protein